MYLSVCRFVSVFLSVFVSVYLHVNLLTISDNKSITGCRTYRSNCNSRASCPWWRYLNTNLLSPPGSFLSRTFSHLRNRKRWRRGEALGVELLDHAASSSLDGVISMEGSCRYSLVAGHLSDPFSIQSFWLVFLVRRIFRRRRRTVGVEQLDQL